MSKKLLSAAVITTLAMNGAVLGFVHNMQWPRPAITSAANVTLTLYAQTDQGGWDGGAWIGYGATPDGTAWTWIPAYWSSDTGLGKEITNSFSIATQGSYYYASKWTRSGTTYYGWNVAGQTNQTMLQAAYTWAVTNAGGASGVSLADFSAITGLQYFAYSYDVVPEPALLFAAALAFVWHARRTRTSDGR